MQVTTERYWEEPSELRLMVVTPAGPIHHPLREGARVTVGRGADADLVIDHGSLSRVHATVSVHDGAVIVEDLGSRNGTRIGRRSLGKGEGAVLAAGEALLLGAVLVVLQSPSAPGRPTSRQAPTRESRGGPMGAVDDLVEVVADTPVSVLLLGETGVGKTTIAERIHELSRRSGQLVKINCAAIPEALLEAELFGFERGAFTGAHASKEGLIEAASTGTLLLDEIGDMPLPTQAKLLHAVERGEVLRLGAVKPRKVDVRVVAATHRDLLAMIREQRFRADLYYRIAGVTITVPPLRERGREVLTLARGFLEEIATRMRRPALGLSPEAEAALLAQPWPGNLRELRNVMDRAAVLSRGAVTEVGVAALGVGAASAASVSAPPEPNAPGGDLRKELDAFERRRIVEALEAAGGNQARAAEMLNLPLRTFVNRLTAHGLTKPRRPSR